MAISGLNKQEAITLLQRQGLSTAQQAQILSSAGLLQTTQMLNASLVEEAVLNSKISGEKAEQILTELGVIEAKTGNLVVTKECTVAEVAQALATKGIVGADAEAILSQLGLATANTTTTVSFSGLTTAIKANTAAMAKWLVTNPVGWCILAVGAIYGLTKAYDALTVSEEEMAEAHEESVQKAKDSISEYEELKQELETIQQTYDDNEQKLKDLYKLRENQTITQAEQDYLEELEAQNEKLEAQIKHKQTLADIEAKEAEDDAINVLNDKTEDGNFIGRKGGKAQYEQITPAEKIARNTSTINNLTADLNAYEKVIKDISLSQEEVDKYTQRLVGYQEQLNSIEGDSDDANYQREFYQGKIDEIQSLLNGTLTYEQYEKAVSEATSSVEGLIKENGELLEEVEPLNNAIVSTTGKNYELKKSNEEIIANAYKASGAYNEYTDSLNGTADALNNVQGSTSASISVSDVFSMEDSEGESTLLSDLNDQLSDVKNAYETCLSARDEFNEQGYISVDTMQSVLALGDEYLQYLFDEEGNVSLDAEAFQKLTLARINDMETQALNDLANNIKQITDEATATEYLTQKQNDLASSYTDTAINALVAMKSIAGFSDSEALQGAYNSFVTQYEQIKSLFAKTKAGIKTEYSGISDKDTNTTDYKSILDKEITAQEKAYEAGKTTFKKYLDNRKQLVEKYYHDKKITTAEYYEELEDLAQAEADFYDDVLAAVTRRIQREIDGIQDIIDGIQKQIDQLEKQKDTYDSVISAVTRRYDKEIESINDVIEALEKQNEELEKQQDNYDGAIDAIVKFLESQKDAIQDNIDSINDENDAIQDQIDKYDQLLNAVTLVFNEKRDALQAEQDAIQDRIDALREENDEAEKAIELEKAKNELYKAQQQRTKLLYSGEGRGFIYQTDTDAIADAEQTLSELTFESTIEALETEKQLLQDVIDKLDETEQAWQDIADAFDNKKAKSTAQELFGDDYENIILNGDPDMIASIMNQYTSAQQKLEDNDNTITSLEEQMTQFDEMIEKWESVASAKEDATNREYAALLLGQQWQQIILSNRETDFENFKNKYLAIQDQIEDNQTLIDSYNEKIEYYENLKAEWEELSSLYQEMLEDKMAQDILGADWEAQIQAGRLEAFDAFKDNYLSIQAQIDDNQSLIDSYNEKIEYYEDLKAQWEDISDVYQREVDDQLITQALGANGEADILSGRLETLNAFKEQYLAAQQALADAAWASANEQIKAAKEAEKGANGTTGDSPDITNETTATPQYLSPSKTNVERIAEDLAQFADDFESGSTKSGGGTTALDKRLRLQAYAKGGIINDENSSGALDWLAKLLGEDHTVVVGNGERVLSSKDNQAYEKLLDLSSRIQPNIPDVNVNPFDYTKIRSDNREMNVTQNINITLPNVTNTSGYDKLVKELQGLQIMAYQNSFKK